MDPKEQIKLLGEWQKDKDPAKFMALRSVYNPMIHKTVNSYKTTGLPKATVNARANAEFVNAMSSYKPNKNTQFSTHVFNYLRKVQRTAVSSLTSSTIPENRRFKMATYNTAKMNLSDELHRDPTSHELSDVLSWSPKEVAKYEKELGGEVTASGASFDYYGNSNVEDNKDMNLLTYMYHGNISPQEKLFMEHKHGFGGKKILSNKDIANKLKTNEMAITRMSKKLSDELKAYR